MFPKHIEALLLATDGVTGFGLTVIVVTNDESLLQALIVQRAL
jgi:hypothetical protein